MGDNYSDNVFSALRAIQSNQSSSYTQEGVFLRAQWLLIGYYTESDDEPTFPEDPRYKWQRLRACQRKSCKILLS